jgi:protein tyrosine phosphatase
MCADGASRTGVVIALDLCMRQLDQGADKMSLIFSFAKQCVLSLVHA